MDKCKVLHIGSNQHYRQYRLGGDLITVSDVEKDLGILIDNKLTFHKQCLTAVTKILGIIRRSFEYTNAHTMLCLYIYKSLIRPGYHRIWECYLGSPLCLVSHSQTSIFSAGCYRLQYKRPHGAYTASDNALR